MRKPKTTLLERIIRFFSQPLLKNSEQLDCEKRSVDSGKADDINSATGDSLTASQSGKKSILLLSTQPANREELTQQLKTWDHPLTICDNASTAMEYLARSPDGSFPWQYVIVDQRQLESDPLSIAHHLKAIQPLASPVLILVGPVMPEERQNQLLEAGYNKLLATPLSKPALFHALQGNNSPIHDQPGVSCLLTKFEQNHPRMISKSILLATQDPDTRDSALTILENEGHVVCISENGQQALNALESNVFDLAIVDADLPNLSGLQVINIHHLDCPVEHWMPFILLTEEDQTDNSQYYEYSRIKACLSKPLHPQKLVKTLHDLIQSSNHKLRQIKPISIKEQLEPSQTTAQEVAPILDKGLLKNLEEIGANSNFIPHLVNLFEENGRLILTELQEAVYDNDVAAFREQAHLMLDNASHLGAMALYKQSLNASQISQEQFVDEGDLVVDQIRTTFSITDRALQRYLANTKNSLSRS